MRPERDAELGAALRALEVPAHRPDFWDRLLERLGADEGGDELARRRMRRARRRWSGLGVVAVGIAALILVTVGLPGRVLGPQVASAQEVTRRAARAVATARTVSGQAEVHEVDVQGNASDRRVSFTLDRAGDVRTDDLSDGTSESYRAETGTRRTLRETGGSVVAIEETGLPPGEPDGTGPDSFLRRDLAGVVQALVEAEDASVRETTFDERPAWRLVADVTPNLIGPSADGIEVVVDRATAIPVEITEKRAGAVVRRVRVLGLAVDRPVPPGTFELAFPPEAAVSHADGGFRRTTLEGAAAVVGYRPAVPSALPDGFQVSEVAVATSAPPTGAEGLNPPSRQVVSISYRRGLEGVIVTTRTTGPDPFAWSDPFRGEGQVSRSEAVTIRGGAFDGALGEVIVDALGLPHLWALGPDQVLTLSGDLGRDALVAAAGSMRRE